MKLWNKKTGEIIDIHKGQVIIHYDGGRKTIKFNSIEELEDWEDYKEPKEYWFIAELCAGLQRKQDTDNGEDRFNKQIGNYFETKEEAEKAVEKLKAITELRKSGAEILRWELAALPPNAPYNKWELINIKIQVPSGKRSSELLDLLFGGEE